jgi:hypothetical protein
MAENNLGFDEIEQEEFKEVPQVQEEEIKVPQISQ